MRTDEFVNAVTSAEPQLRRYVAGFATCPADVDDIMAETWCRAWAHQPEFAARGSVEGWLRRICRTALREWRSHHKSDRLLVPLSKTPDVAQAVEHRSEADEQPRDDDDDDLLSLVMLLTPHRRRVVLSYYIESMTTEEIAESMGCASGTVRATLHQARKQLRAVRERVARDEQVTWISRRSDGDQPTG